MSTPQPLPPEEALWDANDVACYLKASRAWVYMKSEQGVLPCLRIGGLVRFDPAGVRAWAMQGASRPARTARTKSGPLLSVAGATLAIASKEA